jgi:putative ABC transport system substrate-binding protein
MRRRDFITLSGGAAASTLFAPFTARAQQPAMPVIGFLWGGSRQSSADRLQAFRQGLSESGYVEGQNVSVEFRWADEDESRLAGLATDLVRRPVTVIVASGIATALAAKVTATTIPIVFFTGDDPVRAGLVANLNRPGGNLTGVTTLNVEVGPKRLELLHQVVPTAAVIALLVNPTRPNAGDLSEDIESAARTLGLQLHVMEASTERDLDSVFTNLDQLRIGALVIATDAFFIRKIEQLAAQTVRYNIPAIYQYRAFAAAGGLMSYGGSFAEPYHLVGVYTGRVLKGEKPADLPVQQVTKVELIINMKTAKALGLTVPLSLLGRADEVIE